MAEESIHATRVSTPRLQRLLAGRDPLLFLPYLYVLALGLAIFILQQRLLFGPGAVDARFTLVVPLALAAFGQSLALFTRGIDLSMGGVISLTTALLATRGDNSGPGLVLELVALLAMGAAMGALNGFLIARTGLQPFIVTLATWSIWDGVALLVLAVDGGTVPAQLTSFLLGNVVWGIPKSVVVTALLFAAWLWLRHTHFIIDIKALGSDEMRARLSGVRVTRRKVQTYAASGVCAVLVGIWVAAQNASGSPTAGDQFILNSVAAVVVGGSSIFGGKGSIASSIMGAITLLMIPDLIYALNLTSFWSTFFQGFLLVVAVTITSLGLQFGGGRRG